MTDILSNDEIEALLDMFRAEEAHIEAPREEDFSRVAGTALDVRGPTVSRVDLFKPNRLSREHLSALESVSESAARAIGAATTDKMRREVICDCVGVEQLRFGSWLSQLVDPVALYVLRLPPLDHVALLSVSTGMLYAAVDRILGGTGRVTEAPEDLTDAEYTVADAFVGPCLDRICKSLEPLGEIGWEIERRLSNPSAAQIIGDHEVAVSVYYQISGEFLAGDMRLVLPYSMIEPHLDNLTQSQMGVSAVNPEEMAARVEEVVREVDLDFRVELGSGQLSIRDLMALRVGDVVPLDSRLGEPMLAPVQGIPKFKGVVGVHGPRLAYRVESMIN